jgi:hypothetical protein
MRLVGAGRGAIEPVTSLPPAGRGWRLLEA